MKTHSSSFGSLLLHCVLVVSLFLATAPVAWTCSGTPAPPSCPRTIWLAAFCPRTVVVQDLAVPIHVPVSVLPFLTWAPLPCPQPSSASLTLTLTCTPVGGGGPVVIGPVTYKVPTPVLPGAQAPAKPLDFIIPGGTLTSLPDVCMVAGTYTATFPPAAGPGGGPLSASGNVEVCLVPPAPHHPGVPRLDMQLLTDPLPKAHTGDMYGTCRKGDQALIHYLITNNDDVNSVNIDLSAIGKQTAGLPDGVASPAAAYAAGLFAIADPAGDAFGQAFADTLMPGQLVPDPDPMLPPESMDRNDVTILPLQALIVSVALKSRGTCPDGSCNRHSLMATGMFADATPALACASTALLVNSVAAKSPLCEFTETITVADTSIAFWSPGQYANGMGPLDHVQSFATGNQPPGNPVKIELVGLSLQSIHPFSVRDTSYLRARDPATQWSYNVDVQIDPPPGQNRMVHNEVSGMGLGALPAGTPASLPLITPSQNPPVTESFFQVMYDFATDGLQISGFGQLQGGGTIPFSYGGTLTNFETNPTSHPTMSFDPGTARTIAKSGGLSAPVVTLQPRAMTRAFSHSGMVSFFDVFLTTSDGTDLSGSGASWLGVISPSRGVKLLVKTGTLDTPLPVVFSTKGPKANAASNISVLRVRVPGAINSPLLAPINVRVLKDICLQDDTTPALQIAFNSQNGDYHFCAPGVNLLGRGKLTFAGNGSMITLAHTTGDRMVSAMVDLGTHTGSASVTLLPAMTHFTITDTNTANNTCTCP